MILIVNLDKYFPPESMQSQPGKPCMFCPIGTASAQCNFVFGLLSRSILRYLRKDWIAQSVLCPPHDLVLFPRQWSSGEDLLGDATVPECTGPKKNGE